MFSIKQVSEKAKDLESMVFCTQGLKVSIEVYKKMGDIVGKYGFKDIDDFTDKVAEITKESYFNFTGGFVLFVINENPISVLSSLDFMSINNLYLNEGFYPFKSVI